MSVQIIRGNALALPLADESVDLVVTSPPYFGLRSYQDGGEHYDGQIGSEATPAEFVDALLAATAEMVRVLKHSGSIFVNLGDKYAGSPSGPRRLDEDGWERDRSYTATRLPAVAAAVPQKSLMGVPWRYAIRCVDDLGLILRAEIIWSKPNGLPESVTDRVRRSHETWFHFTRSPRYFSAVDEIREEHDPAGLARRAYAYAVNDTQRASKNPVLNGEGMRPANPLGKLPGSVWSIPTQPLIVPAHVGVDHFAAFPMEWPRRLIQGWSPSGICTECGEGRRPVADRVRTSAAGGVVTGAAFGHTRTDTADGRRHTFRTEVTVTGEACACPELSAATRPAVVLDPFGGTGTTALVAHALGRHGISVDMSHDYCRLARWRTSDPGELARAMQVEKPPSRDHGTDDLLALIKAAP